MSVSPPAVRGSGAVGRPKVVVGKMWDKREDKRQTPRNTRGVPKTTTYLLDPTSTSLVWPCELGSQKLKNASHTTYYACQTAVKDHPKP